MAEQGEAQSGVVADLGRVPVYDIGGLVDGVGAQVGELGGLEVVLHGVEIGRVARAQALCGPASMRRHDAPDEGDLTLVSGVLRKDL